MSVLGVSLIVLSFLLSVSPSANRLLSNESLFPYQFQCAADDGSAKFSGCDFDLTEKDPRLLNYLSDECQQIARNNKASEEYKVLLQEALVFADVQRQLDAYERRKNPNVPIEPDGSGIPQKQWEMRNKIYSTNHLFQCIKPNASHEEIMNCVIRLRKNMSDSIALEHWTEWSNKIENYLFLFIANVQRYRLLFTSRSMVHMNSIAHRTTYVMTRDI